jgi:hypothetical protein
LSYFLIVSLFFHCLISALYYFRPVICSWSARDKSMWVADDIARSSPGKSRGPLTPAQAAAAESARVSIALSLSASDGLQALDDNEGLLRCTAEQLLLLSNGLVQQ